MFCCFGPSKKVDSNLPQSINKIGSGIPSINKVGSGIKPNGVSVHWLQTGLMEEVKKRGLSQFSNIYEIENLSSKTHGVIRTKGENVICPRDGKMGAAYVDCLEGDDNVGPSNIMLSYGWRYTIGDVIDTLVDYCKSIDQDTKDTYVWICCLCNNQHRVVEAKNDDTKSEDTFEEFQRIFHDRVVDIGHMVALMSPWDKPGSLSRIWCIFELYVANENENCQLTIAMPPREKKAMVNALRKAAGVEELYKNLSETRVENAEASEELDRIRILEMVRNGPGYHALNQKVNELLRTWVQFGLLEAVKDYKRDHSDVSGDPEYAMLCNDIGKVMRDSTALEDAETLQQDALAVFKACDEAGTLNTIHRRAYSDSHNNYGLLLKTNGDYPGSKAHFQKAMEIGKTIWSDNDYDAAQTYNNIGLALDDMGEYEGALEAYEEAQMIVENCMGKTHVNVAGAISNIAYLLEKMGRRDQAIEKMKQVIAIDEKSNGLNHPDTANSYNILGVILSENGDHEGALVQYRKALVVRERVFGSNSPTTATTYHNIGTVLYDLGKYDEALVDLQRAYDIYARTVGKDHPEPAVTLSYIEMIKNK